MPDALVHRIVLLYLLLLAGPASFAQNAGMKHYSVNDGLPSGTIYSMLSDSKGYLWFATDAGVSRFDGHKFTNFTLSDGLSDNEVIKVAEDSKGRIWLLGFSGTLCYYYNGKFFNYFNDPVLKKAKIDATYFSLFEDRAGCLWFSHSRGYLAIDDSNVTKVETEKRGMRSWGIVMNYGPEGVAIMTPTMEDGRPDQYTGLFAHRGKDYERVSLKYHKMPRSRFCYLQDGNILFVSPDGIVRQKDTSQQLIIPAERELTGTKIFGVNVSSDNRLWIQTKDKGIFCYNLNDLSHPPVKYLEHTGIADVVEDREHNIWIATFGEGLYMLHEGYASVSNYYSGNEEWHKVYCVAKDQFGSIYTGHDNGVVNMLKNGITSQVAQMKPVVPLENNKVAKIAAHNNDMWVGADYGLVHIQAQQHGNIITNVLQRPRLPETKSELLPVGAIKDITCCNGSILTCTGYWCYVQDTSGGKKDILKVVDVPPGRKYCILAEKKGKIWFGQYDGLYSYDGKSLTNHATETDLLTNSIYDIEETTDSVLVLASYGYGMLLYKDGKVLQHLTEADGLTSNLCRRTFVRDNDIYVATPNGGMKLTYDRKRFTAIKKYTTANGLLTNNVNDIYADDSDICFATPDGLTILHTAGTETKAKVPPLYITGISCKGRQLIADSNYTLSNDQNSLQFRFTAISYRVPEDVFYRYRLTDEGKWMETKNTSIDIPYLAPGNYHFQLSARIADGAWSDTRSFYFSILPPFWKTYWFIAACVLIFLVIVTIFTNSLLKARKRKDAETIKIKDQITYLEQQALQAMMNPHFIFNVMNSIQHYINNNEKHEANLYLADFARLIRMNLDISSKRYIPIDEEVAYLELYLSLERIRFGKRLTYKIDVDATIDTDETMIPVMLLQPFIENAIWHGILPKKENGHVEVGIMKEPGGMLKILITDNGMGMPDKAESKNTEIKTHVSKGMLMTQQRLDLIGRITGHTLYIHIREAFPGEAYKGTQVELSLPGDLS